MAREDRMGETRNLEMDRRSWREKERVRDSQEQERREMHGPCTGCVVPYKASGVCQESQEHSALERASPHDQVTLYGAPAIALLNRLPLAYG